MNILRARRRQPRALSPTLPPASCLLSPPKVVTLDYWDTIYQAVSTPDRVRKRHESVQALLERLGAQVSAEEFVRLYKASAVEAERWWRDEHRGYRTADRIRWLLAQLAIERPDHCEHIALTVAEIDESLTSVPPPLLAGALSAGMRAVRLDQMRPGGSSDAEYVATSYEGLVRYLTSD